MHAMGDGINTKENQRQKMNDFIQGKLDRYHGLIQKSKTSKNRVSRHGSSNALNERQAYRELGYALHAAMDSTSPAHKDFQVWRWEEDVVSKHGDLWNSVENLDAAQNWDSQSGTLKAMEDVMNGIDL